jgi:hypothetical protein
VTQEFLETCLQVLAVAVAVDCDTVGCTDCSEVMQKRKAADKSKEEIKEQTQFQKSVGGALTRFATNESMAAYASGVRHWVGLKLKWISWRI